MTQYAPSAAAIRWYAEEIRMEGIRRIGSVVADERCMKIVEQARRLALSERGWGADVDEFQWWFIKEKGLAELKYKMEDALKKLIPDDVSSKLRVIQFLILILIPSCPPSRLSKPLSPIEYLEAFCEASRPVRTPLSPNLSSDQPKEAKKDQREWKFPKPPKH